MSLVPLLVASCFSSCSGSYWIHRGQDFGECFVFSAHMGVGGNVQARVGPVDTGLGLFIGGGSGKAHWWHYGSFAWVQGGVLLVHGVADGLKLPVRYTRSSFVFLTPLTYGASDISKLNWHAPTFDGDRVLPGPFFYESHWFVDNFFSVEVGANLFVGGRVGVNLAEFADFIVGWFGMELVPPFEVPSGEDAPPNPALQTDGPSARR